LPPRIIKGPAVNVPQRPVCYLALPTLTGPCQVIVVESTPGRAGWRSQFGWRSGCRLRHLCLRRPCYVFQRQLYVVSVLVGQGEKMPVAKLERRGDAGVWAPESPQFLERLQGVHHVQVAVGGIHISNSFFIDFTFFV